MKNRMTQIKSVTMVKLQCNLRLISLTWLMYRDQLMQKSYNFRLFNLLEVSPIHMFNRSVVHNFNQTTDFTSFKDYYLCTWEE